MIKRLIFDLDNTLILWKDEYVRALIKTIEEFDLDIDYKPIDYIIGNMENTTNILTKEKLLCDINEKCNLDLNMEFIDRLLENQKDLSPEKDEKMIDTFEYLSKKYEIVLLTNYFKESQIGRIEKLGIKDYFDEFYGCEDNKLKPSKEAFDNAVGNNKYEECIMIGDNYKLDIVPALELGIKVIQADLTDKIESANHEIIKNIYELKEML